MSGIRFAALTALLLLGVVPVAWSQGAAHEDLAACSGSEAEPAQSGLWRVAFCNRTGHDIVIEFRDNDCPAQSWSHRGDVYRRGMRRGETVAFPLCYANERSGSPPPAGVPLLRIPGGRGVVTTWSIVGDCGEHSEHLYQDARTFYDRGDYRSGIILLQYPGGAAHCSPGAAEPAAASAAARVPAPAAAAPAAPPAIPIPPATAPAPVSAAPTPSSPAPAAAASVAAASAAATTAAGASPTGAMPQLRTQIDNSDIITRTVQVLGKNGAAEPDYECSFTLVLSFSDGGSYRDRVKKATVKHASDETLVISRKYFKSVVKADLNSLQCSAH
jgi:hypothetical protein